jgi:hypothetical protein
MNLGPGQRVADCALTGEATCGCCDPIEVERMDCSATIARSARLRASRRFAAIESFARCSGVNSRPGRHCGKACNRCRAALHFGLCFCASERFARCSSVNTYTKSQLSSEASRRQKIVCARTRRAVGIIFPSTIVCPCKGNFYAHRDPPFPASA